METGDHTLVKGTDALARSLTVGSQEPRDSRNAMPPAGHRFAVTRWWRERDLNPRNPSGYFANVLENPHNLAAARSHAGSAPVDQGRMSHRPSRRLALDVGRHSLAGG